jgi:hypothetical protein
VILEGAPVTRDDVIAAVKVPLVHAGAVLLGVNQEHVVPVHHRVVNVSVRGAGEPESVEDVRAGNLRDEL